VSLINKIPLFRFHTRELCREDSVQLIVSISDFGHYNFYNIRKQLLTNQNFLFMTQLPLVGQDLQVYIQTHHTRYNSYGRVGRPKQGPTPQNTQHPQHSQSHVTCGTRTRKLSKLTVADSQLRQPDNWNR